MGDAGINGVKELLSTFYALLNWRISVNLCRVAVNLSGVEYGVSACEQQP